MQRRKQIILVTVVLLIVGGLASYAAWLGHLQKPAPLDTAELPGCDLCTAAKRDLADQVREHKLQSGQERNHSPDSQ